MTLASGGRRLPLTRLFILVLFVLFVPTSSLFAQQYDPSLYAGLQWRQIGPFRAGRVTDVSGVPGQPAVYYMGTAGGGAWKTTDGGMIWKPIFDSAHVASIGAIAVAPSNPNIVYIGTGDVTNVGGSVNQGNGVWKSTDAGATWQHVGLDDTRHIGAMWVDPKNPNVVFVAALGHTYSKSADRGIFKTTDGGNTWRKVLYKDDETGGVDVSFAANNPQIGFAALWFHHVNPDLPYGGMMGTGGGGIYKTSDAGETWTPVTIPALANAHLGRIGVVVTPDGKRVFAIVSERTEGGLFRSDDGGVTWKRITEDKRVVGNGYFSKVFVDPRNSDVVYVGQTSLYRSTDGGVTFESYKGAPGGDDNHALWIDPTNSDYMIMGSDQGAVISMDGGKTWSSWYNQPTGQMYNVSVDNRWPYWVYAPQQDSGAVGTLSRGDYGAITFLDWDPIGGYEFGHVLPSPLDPNILYLGGEARGLWRLDRSSRQVKVISPNVSRDGDWRTSVNPPIVFSPQEPHLLYEGTQFVMETRDEGATWKAISPDLTNRPGETVPPPPTAEEESKPETETTKGEEAKTKEAEPKKPKEEEAPRPPDRRAITVISPSSPKAGVMWVGTNNGLVQMTTDGGANWQNVSPPGFKNHAEVTSIEPSRFDAATAYVTIDNHLANDFRAHIFRTRDYGKTWQEVVAGIPDFSFAKVVREDPKRRELLYAGTENGPLVSFDSGDHWSSLQQNMPTVSVRDLVVHDDDLVAATYGRSFWILDDVSSLRQIDGKVAQSNAYLFKPAAAIRVRDNMNQDTPFPPDLPAGDNPPDGAIIDYYLKSAPAGDVTIAIYDQNGQLVRQLSSKPEPMREEEPPPVPSYWLYHPPAPSKNAGTNRYVWDLRYTAPDAVQHTYPIAALLGKTHAEPQGPFVVPGTYQVKLMVDGKTYTQPLEVKMDPRVKITTAALDQQLALGRQIDELTSLSFNYHEQAAKLLKDVEERESSLKSANSPTTLQAVLDFQKKADKLQGDIQRGWPGPGKPKPTFTNTNAALGTLGEYVNQADQAPTDAMRTAYRDLCQDLTKLTQQWSQLMSQDLPAMNSSLTEQKMHSVEAVSLTPAVPVCQ